MFVGLLIPYKIKNIQENKIPKNSNNIKKENHIVNEAILGGGDIAFSLMFSGVILKLFGFIPAFITSITAAAALLFLFIIAEKKRFYPAMPFITAGCLIGYLIIFLAF
jgi:presenilin-like A22 family membrane protease